LHWKQAPLAGRHRSCIIRWWRYTCLPARRPRQVHAWLQAADPALARQVLDYQQHHCQGEAIISAAKQRTST
jgi:hypothetical protein